jgi:hypothetical protein
MRELYLKNLIKICLMMFLVVGITLFNTGLASSLRNYDSNEQKMTRYWQGLYTTDWSTWQISYNIWLLDTHDKLYQYTQKIGKGGYFKNGEITERPLVIWFVYPDGKISEPHVIKTSGSKKYDLFNVEVIKKTKVPEFPERKNRIFMWDGELNDLVKFLRYKEVLPYTYSFQQKLSPQDIHWERL